MCRKADHNANQEHYRKKVSAAFKKLKIEHPTDLLTEGHNEYLAGLFGHELPAVQVRTDDEANWVKHGDESQNEGEVSNFTTPDLINRPETFIDAEFVQPT